MGGTMEIGAADHALEQECLFYVATSRAQDRLLLYSARQTVAKARRDPSPFISRLGIGAVRETKANTDRCPDPEELPLPITMGSPIRITTAQLSLYERCPRRFLYTHVLGVGGRRTPTTMTRMHDLVRDVVTEIASTQPSPTSLDDMERLLEQRWSEGPLAGEEYRQHRAVAEALLRRFVDLRAGAIRAATIDLQAGVGVNTITAEADDVVTTVGGRHAVRMVRTGHRSSTTAKNLADAAFQIAASASLPGCDPEIVHLGDDDPSTPVSFNEQLLGRRAEKLVEMFTAIGGGRFAPERSDRICPFCPAFFACGLIVDGSLQKSL